jgi:hypothetical protein
MAKYLFAYRGGSTPQSEDEQQAVMAKWTGWFGELGPAVVDAGNPFSVAASVASDGSVTDGGGAQLTGYSLLQADSLQAATEMAKGCPVLEAGGSVEVYESFDVMG